MDPAVKITCEIDKTLAAQMQSALESLRIERVQTHARRAVVLRERGSLGFLPPTTRLEEIPIDVHEFYLPGTVAADTLLALAHRLDLFTAGRGAIHAEEVQLADPAGIGPRNDGAAPPREHAHGGRRPMPLVLVNCVVQRGRGNDIARSALELGGNVPSVNFGIGTGVRDRLGLLRIAIPAEKEIVSLLVEPADQVATLESLIAAGRLDQPGRGFVGASPVAYGIPNPKSFRGRQRHSATMDQVITAIDDLAAGTAWRRRSAAGMAPTAGRHWQRDCLDIVLNCNEGASDPLLPIVLAGGAGGATVSRAKLVPLRGGTPRVSPAREVIDFGLAPDRLDGLIRALQEERAFDANIGCFIETKPLPLALTYSGR